MKGFQLKNSLPYLKYVLRLSCVVHGSIYGRFTAFYVNGFLSYKTRGLHRRDVTHILSKVSCFYWNPFIFVGYRNDRLFPHTNPYISNVTQQRRSSYFELGLPLSYIKFLWMLKGMIPVSDVFLLHKIYILLNFTFIQ